MLNKVKLKVEEQRKSGLISWDFWVLPVELNEFSALLWRSREVTCILGKLEKFELLMTSKKYLHW